MESPSKQLENESITIIKKKIVAFDKLLKHREKIEAKCEELIVSAADKDSEISRLSEEVERLRRDLQEKTARCSHLEGENQKKSQQIGQLEISQGKKHCDIINKEIELNKLRREIEDLKAERENFEEKLKNDVQVKKMREEYEKEKWKHLGTISSLTQSNASLKEMIKDTNDFAQAQQTEVKELQKYKQEALLSKTEIGKKDRLIASLTKKLEKLSKLNYHIGKRGGGGGADSSSDFDIPESHSSSAAAAASVSEPTFLPTIHRRFVIFNAKRISSKRRRAPKILFHKLGPLELGDLPWLVAKPPRISDAVPTASLLPEQDSEAFLPEENEGKDRGAKRPRHEETPTSPKKRQKGGASPVKSMGEEMLSPLSSSTPQKSRSIDRGEPEHSSLPSSSSSSGGVVADLRKSSPRRKTNNNKINKLVDQIRPVPSEASLSSHVPVVVQGVSELIQENGSTSICFNPNPARVRQAHRTDSVLPADSLGGKKKGKSSIVEAAPAPPSQGAGRLTGGQGAVVASEEKAAGTECSTKGMSARKKIIQEGFKIEVGYTLHNVFRCFYLIHLLLFLFLWNRTE
jgi:hypothetical protein